MNICVDTFHHPYVQLDHEVHFPEINLEHGHGLPVELLLKTLRETKLDWFQLPARQDLPLSRSHPDCLHLASLVPAGHGLSVLILLRIRASFLGGDSGTAERRQGVSPEFLSSRVYFHCFLLPALSSSTQSDMDLVRYAPSLGVSVQKEAATGWFRPTALFDSPDFTHLDKELSTRFSFGQSTAFLSLHHPFQIQHGTLALCLLAPVPSLLGAVVEPYIDLIQSTLDAEHQISHATENYWKEYYASFRFTRFLSPSGNPHWLFDSYPGSKQLGL